MTLVTVRSVGFDFTDPCVIKKFVCRLNQNPKVATKNLPRVLRDISQSVPGKRLS